MAIFGALVTEAILHVGGFSVNLSKFIPWRLAETQSDTRALPLNDIRN